jgi:hypothetical protein
VALVGLKVLSLFVSAIGLGIWVRNGSRSAHWYFA